MRRRCLLRFLSRGSEVVARKECVGVVGAEDACHVGQDVLVHGDGRGDVPRLLVCVGEVVACGEGVGVVGAEDAGAVSQEGLVHGDGFLEVS